MLSMGLENIMVSTSAMEQVDFVSGTSREALPSIDVIIPVYNVESYIGRCVNSVLQQEGVVPNIILVDDGSTDNSSEICDSLVSTHRDILAIHTENKGVSAARNIGLEFCCGEYVTFVDPDDYLAPGTLAALHSSLKSSQADISFCEIIREWEDGTTSPLRQTAMGVVVGEKVVEAYLTDSLFTGVLGKLFRRGAIGAERFPALAMSEDALFLIRLAIVDNLTVTYCASGSYRYWQRKGSARLSVFNDKQLDSLECADEVEVLVHERCPKLSGQASAFSFAYYIGTLSRLYAWNAAEQRKELILRLVTSLHRQAHEGRGHIAFVKLLAWWVYRCSPQLFAALARKYYSRTLYRGLGE